MKENGLYTDIFIESYNSLEESFCHHRNVHGNELPEYARSQIVRNILGQHAVLVREGQLAQQQLDILIQRFNEISEWNVTMEEINNLLPYK